MTCIIGIEREGSVWIGGDRAISEDDDAGPTIQATPKVWLHGGNVLIGGAGILWQLQKLRYATKIKLFRHGLPEEWLAMDLAPAIRGICGDGSDHSDVLLLVGIGGKLFSIDGSGSFSNVGPEHSVGTGAPFARGALDVLSSSLKPETRIRRALQTAARCSNSVAPPFDVLTISA